MDDTSVTAESAAMDAAETAVQTMATGVAPEPTATTEAPRERKASDIFGEIEQDIKSQYRSEKAKAQPREGGKFAKPEGSEPDPDPETPPAAPEAEAVPEDPAPEPKKLAAEFQVTDADGELEIPDIRLSFKANGKDMKDVPLDRVVKLAQWGAYNEEREQAVREAREAVPQYEQAIADRDQQLAAYAEAYQSLLADPTFYEETQARFMASQTPEAQLQRLHAEREQERQTRETEQANAHVQAQATQFVQYLAPKLEALVAQHPNVSFDEVFGRYNLLTAPLLVAGRVPPERFMQVDHLVDTELAGFVASLNTERSTAKKQATATVADAKRQMARAVAPRGTTPSITPAKPAPITNYTKATDILADLPNLVRQAVA